jgi:branched-chain amino acid aminotransferase
MANAILASIDGEVDTADAVRLPVTDDGFLRGDGAFELIKLYEGVPFRLREHLDRLRRSADSIHLAIDEEALEREIERVLEREAAPEGCLRIVVTRGGHRILIVEEKPEWPATARVHLVSADHATLLAGVKSISYAANMAATRLAQNEGSDEAILISDDGRVLESPTASIFWADSSGRLHTPSLSEGILDSITRDVVLSELPADQGSYPAEDLKGASEAFLASTTREIQPIAAIDGVELPRVDSTAANAARAVLRAAIEREVAR